MRYAFPFVTNRDPNVPGAQLPSFGSLASCRICQNFSSSRQGARSCALI
uniref:Uncharacterized protein n=1 Tax=Anopheles dirus TaxID=7168 RepID=A0A182NNE4_9DIPT